MKLQNTPSNTSEKVKLLRYDWLTLLKITRNDRYSAIEVLNFIYGVPAKYNGHTKGLAAKYLKADKRSINFLVDGKTLLHTLHHLDVSALYISQMVELAAYRDLYTFQKCRDNRLQKLMVLDILEDMIDLQNNPLLTVDDSFVHFTCERLR